MTDSYNPRKTPSALTRRQFLAAGSAGAIAVAAGLASGLPSAGASTALKPKKGGTLLVARIEPTDGFKLDSATADPSYQLDMAVMEPLLRSASGGKGVVTGLAESFHYDPSAKTYTMKLAQNARFSSGAAVTPRDVAFSLEVWKAGPNYGSTYSSIKSLTTIDDRTFRFNLTEENSALSDFLTWSSSGILPHNFGGKSESEFWQHPVGAGAFMVGEWASDGVIHLTRNPHYYQKGRPYLDAIVSSLTSEATQRALEFRSGQVDVVEGVAPTQAALYQKPYLTVLAKHFTDFLSFNTAKAPFNNVEARRAVAYAIDYQSLAQGIYKGYAEKPTGLVPPSLPYWAPPTKPYFKQDLPLAKKLIAQTGLAKQHLQIIYPSVEGNFGLVAEVVQGSLQAAGLNVTLVPEDLGTFLGEFGTPKYDMGIWSNNAISPDVVDPIVFIYATKWLFASYPTKKLGTLIRDYELATTTASKEAVITEIQNEAFQEVPSLGLDHYSELFAIQSDVHGISPTPWGMYYYDGVWKG
jgi:ABC-type transport system substrate-binding protein